MFTFFGTWSLCPMRRSGQNTHARTAVAHRSSYGEYVSLACPLSICEFASLRTVSLFSRSWKSPCRDFVLPVVVNHHFATVAYRDCPETWLQLARCPAALYSFDVQTMANVYFEGLNTAVPKINRTRRRALVRALRPPSPDGRWPRKMPARPSKRRSCFAARARLVCISRVFVLIMRWRGAFETIELCLLASLWVRAGFTSLRIAPRGGGV